MIIFPAIDIKNGQCVRLYQGNFESAEQVSENYMETALKFKEEGAEWIHMVDLDGAKNACPENKEIFLHVAKETGLHVELGGGIRNMETVDYYLGNGISRVILGSSAIKDPFFVKKAVEKYGDQIAVGIDSYQEKVAVEGWLQKSETHYIDLAIEMQNIGVKYIIFTDISKDGTLTGPNIQQLNCLNQAVSCQIIASGGIHTIQDIQVCKDNNLYGVICGKSLYQNTLSLKEAVAVAQSVKSD